MAGILAYGAYIPYFRLERSRIGETLGTPPGRGTRAVASYDEDTTSMGVEAGRLALAAAPVAGHPEALYFATASPGYLDKTNANAIHAALGLAGAAFAADMAGSVRSGVAAFRAALDAPRPTLAVVSDIRTGLPGGADESEGGDAAAAFVCAGPGSPAGDEVVAEVIGSASATAEFLDRWRVPGEVASRVWEERFGEYAYVPLIEQALTDGLKSAGLSMEAVDHLLVAGTHARAARRFKKGDDLTGVIGNCGTAHPGVLLAHALDQAEPGHTIVVLTVADGADCLVFRATDALAGYRGRRKTTVAEQVESGRTDLAYATFLTWRGLLTREPPRRPDPDRPSAPPSYRREEWKFAFTASRCTNCGFRHLPPARVCLQCHAADQMVPERLADTPATITTYTVDRLAYSPSPPMVAAVIDFDGGGRFRCEMTDVDPDKVAIGDRVEMTFRRVYTAQGVHNYFWKARPTRGGN